MKEWEQSLSKCKRTRTYRNPANAELLEDRELPTSVNWVTAGAVTPIKN